MDRKAYTELGELAWGLFLGKQLRQTAVCGDSRKPDCWTHLDRKAYTELGELAWGLFLGKKLWRQPKTGMLDALGP